jgi:hypothetical protein
MSDHDAVEWLITMAWRTYEDYVYLVPFVEDEQTVFLKTIIPSRRATKEYLGKESVYED